MASIFGSWYDYTVPIYGLDGRQVATLLVWNKEDV